MRSAAMSAAERIPALDTIKAAAIVAVLCTHAVPAFFDRPFTPSELLALTLTGFHVPSFLFVSGFLSRADVPVGWRRVADRLQRLLPPYLVATAAVWAFGMVTFPTFRKLVFVVVTGVAFGHYYFVPVLAFCFLLLPLLSRLGDRGAIAAAVALAIAAEAMWLEPAWRFSNTIFWNVRNPVLQFHVGYFLLGIIASRHRRALTRIGTRVAPVVALTAAAGIAAFTWAATTYPSAVAHPLARTVYTLVAMALLASLSPSRGALAPVRFLSDATLTIYLWHWFAYPPVMPYVGGRTPLPLRMVVLTSAGLAFSTLVVVAGRRLLGRSSRFWLGA